MSDPEMEPWSKGIGRLLDAERELAPIDPAITNEVWAKLEASILALPPPGGSSTGSASGSGAGGGTPGAAGALPLAKALAPVVIAFAVGGVAGAVLHAELSPPIIERVEIRVPVVAPVAEQAEKVPQAGTTTVAGKVPRAFKAPVSTSAKTEEILGRERALVERARTALARGDAMAALGALTQARFIAPAGRLAEERDALEIQALSTLGKKDAAGHAIRRFRARHPKSIFGPVVDAAARSLQSAP